MEIISHRRNTIEELVGTPRRFGVEVDIRSQGDRLVIHHEPYEQGVNFTRWLEHYAHGTLILNIKEEGLEGRLLELMERAAIENFFFLDQSFPFLVKTARAGESRCAVRVSEYESVQTALSLEGLVRWVWIDCLTHFPLTGAQARQLTDAGFRCCLVSPELHGRPAGREVPALRGLLSALPMRADAVCTKEPSLWE